MAFSKEQLLLLNSLIYAVNNDHLETGNKYKTVSDWINSAGFANLTEGGDDSGSFMTSQDWKNIVQSVKNDPKLMNLQIRETHVDTAENGGGGLSMVFTDDSSKEAVVLFRGTAGGEWKDNFTGGNVTDTDQQKNALQWYQDVCEKYDLDRYEMTVTGHSKGGNKSKYITIMDDTVDHCVSFDGQGFSDKFMENYKDRIARRQELIENHNADYDYVNLLLNDIGETTFYKGQEIGNGGGGFLENHCPNSLMKWKEDGSFSMEECPDGQPSEMRAVDAFFNNCLRSLPDDKRSDMLDMAYNFLMIGFSLSDNSSGESWEDFRKLLHDPKTADVLPYLIAYFIQYERSNPETADEIRKFLKHIGLEEYIQYVDIADEVLNFSFDMNIWITQIHLDFDDIMDVINGATGVISADVILERLSKLIKDKWGIEVSREDLKLLLEMIRKVDSDMDEIHIEKNGADIRVGGDPAVAGGSSGTGAGHQFRVQPEQVRTVSDDMRSIAAEINACARSVACGREKINFQIANVFEIKSSFTTVEHRLTNLEKKMNTMSGALEQILTLYEKTETELGVYNGICQ
ncbi:MAG: DUF2974 domain-containing protein [Eubacteriales bacterium]|nr:DUF2974 domain-containing protein [Eubacteriales bacterium]